MMKKILALALCLVLCLTLLPTAFAAGAAKLSLSAEREDTVTTVTVTISGDAGATNGRVKVGYDPSLVTLTECEAGDGNWAVTSLDEDEDATGTVSFAWVGSSLPSETVVLTLTFTDVETAEVESVTYTAECVELYAAGENGPEAMTVSPGKVELTVSYTSETEPEPGVVIVPGTDTGTDTGTDDGSTGPHFVDISGHWAEEDIEAAYAAGLVNGMGKDADGGDLYEPETALSRAMFVTVLYRAEGSPEVTGTTSFVDVAEGSWYADAVDWAFSKGVTNGTSSTTFDPDALITREQLVTMLYRYAELEGRDVTARAELTAFSDVSTVSSWAADAMSWAVAEGIVKGYDTQTLMPQNNATRAQMASILVRFLGL